MFISVQHVLCSVPVSIAVKVQCVGNIGRVLKRSVNTEALSELSACSFPAQPKSRESLLPVPSYLVPFSLETGKGKCKVRNNSKSAN